MLANGRDYLAIPGPSTIPDRVLRAMHRAAPNIYEGELMEVTQSIVRDLRKLACTTGDVGIYIGNGHAAWEAALANTCAPGDLVLVPATGMFAHGWGEMARRLGLRVELMEFGMSDPVDPARLEARLRQDRAHEIRAILGVFVDTSTGVLSDVGAMRDARDAAGHPALLMADCIASLGCDRFEMDAMGADVMVSACQKGLMTPPGVAFVWANARAQAARVPDVSLYWDWAPRMVPEQFFQMFDGTAPTHHLFGLREALDMLEEEGMEAVFARHEALAQAVWAAVDAWGEGGTLRLNVANPAARSRAVTSLGFDAPVAEDLRAWCAEKTGVTLGIGLGREPAAAWFRLGHMGHVNAHMVLGALGAVDAGMKALGIPHGPGGLEAAASVIAERAGP
ncbi:MAG: pyridoxal-phosphate-dependent aminotransferase family protein [Paracoccaceae bacterium]